MTSGLPDWRTGVDILAQTLANITAEVTATALDIRALASEDKAHVGLAYDYEAFIKYNTGAEVHGEPAEFNFDVDEWGASKDFYLYGIGVKINPLPANSYYKYYHSIGILVREFDVAGDQYLPIYMRSFGPRSHPAMRTTEFAAGIWFFGIAIGGNKISAANSIKFEIYNYTGENWAEAAVEAAIAGVPIE